MQITRNISDGTLTLTIDGRIDSITAPELEEQIHDNLDGIHCVILDFNKVEYISSAGLRVLLTTQKAMSRQGGLILTNVNDTVMDVFTVTGFTEILTIQ